jgi:hypothetical protein
MQKTLSKEKYAEVRGYFKEFTKVLVPKALVVAVISGLYLIHVNFGTIGEEGLSDFQIVLAIKAFFGLWLGARGILQVFFGIQPFVFKSHVLPFFLVIVIVFLSKLMNFV